MFKRTAFKNPSLANLPCYDPRKSRERSLTNIILKKLVAGSLHGFRKAGKTLVVTEYEVTGHGLPDVLMARKVKNVGNWERGELYEIVKSSAKARETLERMEVHNKARGDGQRGGGVAKKGRAVPKAELCAFEIKIKDIGRAIKQANRYLDFADKSVIVVPKDYADYLLKNGVLKVIDATGIGLVAVDEKNGSVKLVRKPRAIGPKNLEANLRAKAGLILKIRFKTGKG